MTLTTPGLMAYSVLYKRFFVFFNSRAHYRLIRQLKNINLCQSIIIIILIIILYILLRQRTVPVFYVARYYFLGEIFKKTVIIFFF